MAHFVPGLDYVKELHVIRKAYVESTPRQRLKIIRLRLEDHHFGPNKLVTVVSAVEALARCLLQHIDAHAQKDLSTVYPRFRQMEATSLVRECLEKKGISDLHEFLEEDNW